MEINNVLAVSFKSKCHICSSHNHWLNKTSHERRRSFHILNQTRDHKTVTLKLFTHVKKVSSSRSTYMYVCCGRFRIWCVSVDTGNSCLGRWRQDRFGFDVASLSYKTEWQRRGTRYFRRAFYWSDLDSGLCTFSLLQHGIRKSSDTHNTVVLRL